MSEPKTQPTTESFEAFLEARVDPARHDDCRTLAKMMQKATGKNPVMWGESIVGFDTYRYTYASGKTGDWPIVGFSPRKNDLTIYIMSGFEERAALLEKLGRHKTSKACLYIKKLADLDVLVLKQLVELSVRAVSAIALHWFLLRCRNRLFDASLNHPTINRHHLPGDVTRFLRSEKPN
jgi:hypothetical protein